MIFYAKIVLAFVIALTVSLASQRYVSLGTSGLTGGKQAASNKIRGAFLISQVSSVLVLYVFKNDVGTLISAGIGLLLPKNIMMVREALVRSRAKSGGTER